MFGRSKRDKRIKDLSELVEYNRKRIEEQIGSLREDMEVLKKVANLREYRRIENPSFLSFLGNNASRESQFQEAREKARKEGFDFAYKYKEGDEIWVKYEEAK